MLIVLFGNCQVQYFAKFLVSSDIDLLVFGEKFDGIEPVDGISYIDESFLQSFLDRYDGLVIFIVQQSSLDRFVKISSKYESYADHIINFPYLHYRAPWPQFMAVRERVVTERSIARSLEFEKIEFRNTIEKCGVGSFDHNRFWKSQKENCNFFHPGHVTGEMLSSIIELSFDNWNCINNFLDVNNLINNLKNSPGIFFLNLHPIDLMAADTLEINWANTPLYYLWRDLVSENSHHNKLIVERGLESQDSEQSSLNRYILSHFKLDLARVLFRAGHYSSSLELSYKSLKFLNYHPAAIELAIRSSIAAKDRTYLEMIFSEIDELTDRFLFEHFFRLSSVVNALKLNEWALNIAVKYRIMYPNIKFFDFITRN
ncbi:hypothetical protein ACLB6G_14155 [Zhengella sp. ZM62]|uniref:hypothetical protein n=1 Tax=Zhengella sedimenti TaxID=3390035 RepID=UPI003976E969